MTDFHNRIAAKTALDFDRRGSVVTATQDAWSCGSEICFQYPPFLFPVTKNGTWRASEYKNNSGLHFYGRFLL